MCYSAQIKQGLKDLGFEFRARVDYDLIEDIFLRRSEGEKIGITRGLEANFKDAAQGIEKKISGHIQLYSKNLNQKLAADLLKQSERLELANKSLEKKLTKSAVKEQAVASRQIDKLQKRIKKLNSNERFENDSRIYAFDWAPVIIWRDGERVIVPMRYHLRPQQVGADFDRKYPGCYNARRDSLTGFWRPQFGKNHAILIVNSFFENVESEPGKNAILQFKPQGMNHMIVPCIWDHWSRKGESSLDTFALITDEPPAEVMAAGHDRCPIFIKHNRIDEWLQPKGKSDEKLFELLDDRERPFYENALAG